MNTALVGSQENPVEGSVIVSDVAEACVTVTGTPSTTVTFPDVSGAKFVPVSV